MDYIFDFSSLTFLVDRGSSCISSRVDSLLDSCDTLTANQKKFLTIVLRQKQQQKQQPPIVIMRPPVKSRLSTLCVPCPSPRRPLTRQLAKSWSWSRATAGLTSTLSVTATAAAAQTACRRESGQTMCLSTRMRMTIASMTVSAAHSPLSQSAPRRPGSRSIILTGRPAQTLSLVMTKEEALS